MRFEILTRTVHVDVRLARAKRRLGKGAIVQSAGVDVSAATALTSNSRGFARSPTARMLAKMTCAEKAAYMPGESVPMTPEWTTMPMIACTWHMVEYGDARTEHDTPHAAEPRDIPLKLRECHCSEEGLSVGAT